MAVRTATEKHRAQRAELQALQSIDLQRRTLKIEKKRNEKQSRKRGLKERPI